MSTSRISDNLATELRALSAEQRRALLKLLEKEGIDIGKYQAIVPRAAGEPAPMSYQQQRLWFLAQLEESSAHYNTALFLRITGALNADALIASIEAIVARHEILRTRLVERDGELLQVLDPEPFAVRVRDLSNLRELHELCSAQAALDFDLSREKLIRVVLARHSRDESFLLITFHHSVVDGWSAALFFRELVELYGARVEGRSAVLPPLPIQYGDYAAWQRQWLTGPVLKSQLEYWQKQLAGLPALIELPTDRPRPSVKTYRGGNEELFYPADLVAKLNDLSKRQGTSLYMTLLAAFSALFHRYTGATELAVGSPIANRNRPELEGLIGFFANTLVLRSHVEGDMSFLDLLAQTKTMALDAYERQDIPFEYLVEKLNPERSLSYSPLFQVVVTLQNMPIGNVKLAGVELARVDSEYEVAKFDLGLTLYESDHGLLGTAQFNVDLFDRATIRRLIGHYRRVLEQMVANPNGRIADFDYLTDAERTQLLVEWNATARDYPQDKTLHGLFAEQAARTPGKLAVATADEQVTYAQLDVRVRRAAFELAKHDVPAGELVGVAIEKGCSQVAAVLAVMLAGAAYLPIDVSWPMERQRTVLAAGRCRLVLSSGPVIAEADWPADVTVVDIDGLPGVKPETLDAHSFPAVAATDLAYVIFTSGSTGTPKGVMIEHGSAVNTLLDINERFGITSADSVLAVSSLAFDLSVYDIFGLLAIGGTVVLPRDEDRLDPSAWWSLLGRFGVTLWNSVPAVFQMLVDFMETQRSAAAASARSPLRLALLSGDWVPVDLPRKATELMPALHVVSLGGATEASIWSNCYPIADVTVARRSIPYGKPLANQRFYILNDALKPCPIGVPGYLYIGGVGLARGYWGDEAETRASFIEHEALGQRLYRTGDLGRWLADGNMEFLGRRDGQVKLRGFRIELGEIESCLGNHPAVQACVVVMREDRPGVKSLAAYVVADQSAGDDSSLLRDALREMLEASLPSYMVPAAFVFLNALPLTSNGKVDRSALPAPDSSQRENLYVAPGTPIERALCEVWQAVLGLERVGVTDNFFDIGGHSLLAVRLVNAMQQRLGRTVSLRGLIQHPTIAQLGSSLEEGADSSAAAFPVLAPDRVNAHSPFPLTPLQLAYWVGRKSQFELGNVGAHGYSEVPLSGLDVGRFETAWNRLIERHGMLRMVITAEGEQRVLESVPAYKIRVNDWRDLPGEQAWLRLLEVRAALSHQVFDGEDWPLFEIAVSQLPGNQSVVHMSIDALVFDASSSALVRRELAALYEDPQVELPPLEIGFRDYVLARQRFEQHPAYEAAKAYWSARVAGFPARPDLPLAKDPKQIEQPRFERRSNRLEAVRWQTLTARARQHQATPTVLFLTCFAEVLNRWSQQPHFAVNLTTFNRLPFHPQVNAILGDFSTLTLLEIDYRDAAPSFVERLGAVQKRLWSDLEHRYFDGMEMLWALRRHDGATAGFPVVVTSVLGLTATTSAGPDAEPEADAQRGDVPGGYGISQTSQVWLDVQVTEQDGSLLYNWDSVVGLFPDGMLDAMFTAFGALLESLATDASLWDRPVRIALPRADSQIVIAANATAAEFEAGLLHTPLLRQIERHADKVAVRTAAKSITYRELGERSHVLAAELQSAGAAANRLIGVVMEKGWQQVVAVLGIVRAGAAYLPIDASLPPERIALLLATGEVEHVVTTAAFADLIPAQCTRRYLIDDEWSPPSRATLPRLAGAAPEDLAYVIFTSGSTGAPKGVMIEHRAALNTVQDLNERFAVTANDTVFGLSSLSFDLSVYDIFGVLGAGGTLVLPRPEEYRDPTAWLSYLGGASDREAVTVWNTVPALLQMLVDTLEGTTVELGLRLVLLSGDWIPVALPERIAALAPRAEIVSLGGATEAAIWSIAYAIDRVESHWKSIPYGKALRNQQMYVLSTDLALCPVWVAGDLYIGGTGLARGYWRDEPTTAASFITHPVTHERLYRTGDRGRLLPDGNIEFLGRTDQQVKIQGYRVELGEIEARLAAHPFVAEAAVAVHAVGGGQQLTAYVVGGAEPSDAAPAAHDARAPKLTTAEKVEFKLAQKGVRATGTRPVIDLPRSDTGDVLRLRAANHTPSILDDSPVTLASLGELLRGLHRVRLGDQVLPKAFYPSGGSCYAVQAYLEIAPDKVVLPNGGYLPAGHYYYQPLTHVLAALHGDRAAAHAGVARECRVPFRLYLVADKAAIEPLYGLGAEVLCRLEAGYMGGLLEHSESSGLALRQQDPASAVREAIPETGDSHVLICVYAGGNAAATPPRAPAAAAAAADVLVTRLEGGGCRFSTDAALGPLDLSRVARKSYRSYSPEGPALEELGLLLQACRPAAREEPAALRLYVHLRRPLASRSGAVQVGAGIYVYEPRDGSLRSLGARGWTGKKQLFGGDNRALEKAAAFSLLIAGPRAQPNESYTASGKLGQSLSNYAPSARIGLCAVGLGDTKALEAALQLPDSDRVYHALTGGAVSAAQIDAFEETVAPMLDIQEEILDFLRDGLPPYMIPQHVVPLARLPLSANGKVNRKALPAPSAEAARNEYVAPRTRTERVLAEIWEAVLGIGVGVDDNFFRVGGHSLNSVHVLKRIHQQFGTAIALQDIFHAPTIAELAVVIDGTPRQRGQSPVLLRAGSAPPLFFVHTALGDPEHYVPLANLLAVDTSIFALHVFDQDLEVLRTMSMAQLAARHVDAVRRVQPRGPYRFIGHSVGGLIGYEMASQLISSGDDVTFVGMIDTYQMSNLPNVDDITKGGFKHFVELLITLYDPDADAASIAQIMSASSDDDRQFFDAAKRRGLLSPSLDFDAAKVHSEYAVALLRMSHEYVPAPIAAKVALYAAEASVAGTGALRWSEHLVRGFESHIVGGDHRTVLLPPNIRPLADMLAKELAAATTATHATARRQPMAR